MSISKVIKNILKFIFLGALSMFKNLFKCFYIIIIEAINYFLCSKLFGCFIFASFVILCIDSIDYQHKNSIIICLCSLFTLKGLIRLAKYKLWIKNENK